MPGSLRTTDDGVIYGVSNRLRNLGEKAIGPNGVDVTGFLPDRRPRCHPAAHFTPNCSAR
jgi:hypothetical protein